MSSTQQPPQPFQQAKRLAAVGQLDEARAAAEQELSQRGDQPATKLGAAAAFGFCFDTQRAEQLCEELVAVVPPSNWPAIAVVLQQIQRPERAIALLQQLHDRGELPPPSQATLATLYERSNRATKARELLQECVAQSPDQPQPQVLLARVARTLGDVDEATRWIESVLAKQHGPEVMVHAWTERSLLHDSRDEYDAAVEAIEKSKSILSSLPQVRQQAERTRRLNDAFRQLYLQLDAATIQRWCDVDLGALPVRGAVQLLGFPRSGTTLIEQVLDAHPEIDCSSEQPVMTRSTFPLLLGGTNAELSLAALDRCPTDVVQTARRYYFEAHQSLLGRDLGSHLLVDKNPNHASLLAGFCRMLPESKYLIAIRDPRDVIVSTYMRFFSVTEFSASYLSWESVIGLYIHEMNVLLRMCGLLGERWIPVKYEDLVGDFDNTSRRLARQLGIAFDPAMQQYRRQEQRHVNSPTHAEVRKPLFGSSIGRWRNYERFLAPYLPKLAPAMREFGYEA